MALKNKSLYAILGILNVSPGTGYDIKKYCDTVLSGFWNENFGHIYPTLKKMLDKELVDIVANETNEKKIMYQITPKGRMELETWLVEETQLQPMRSEFMLKLLFSSDQPKDHIIKMLEDYKQIHVNKREKYLAMQNDLEKGIEEISKDRAHFFNAILRRGILSCEATICWCNETIETGL
ncbi:PadR family transcriptional regulator [Clostridium boliviensis]|uniref:PadR family transcriptional regulator n=1 Tax=Clostridium boliviensis TaxID=318465 RepID=A0ABU4GRS8_9CLOT|nr:PadR family transcriptional regulator [Clostridium boliviensis]MDW2800345.1 PadR family transcriptional regulator [Clostridium boliviensis]